MNNKQRITQLEKAHTANTSAARYVVMFDADGDTPAKFDGVQMTQAEAEAKAAALPESVFLIHVQYVPYNEIQNAGGAK